MNKKFKTLYNMFTFQYLWVKFLITILFMVMWVVVRIVYFGHENFLDMG